VQKVREPQDRNYGYNARTAEYEDLIAAGVHG
jgi:chaperonin GroEL (HSP60 family)